MEHARGERRVKGLQKEFLTWIEEHPALRSTDPAAFNSFRKRVFRTTFDAFRLGVLGTGASVQHLWTHLFGWLENQQVIRQVDSETAIEITDRYLRTTLEAYRAGALVAAGRRSEHEVQHS